MSRFTYYSLILLICLMAVGAVWINMPPPMESVATYEVRSGDTLWGIAECLDAPDVDRRDLVDWMADRSSESLTVGQRVPLPYIINEGASCQQ